MQKLPSLEFKYHKETQETSNNTNPNTINNNIIIGKSNKNKSKEINVVKSPALVRPETPSNIKHFKETLLEILISYFKNNIVLINNLVELSDDIVMKVDDLTLLIGLLLEKEKENIIIEVEEIKSGNCCGKICTHLPRYRKIDDIVIDKKQSFKVYFNQYYIQMQTEFNISLDYVML
jgi:hypothetical protein